MIEEFRYSQYSQYSTPLGKAETLVAINKTFKAGDLLEVEYPGGEGPSIKIKPYIYLGTKIQKFRGSASALDSYYDVVVYSNSNIEYITLSSFSFTIRKVKL